VCRCPEAPKVKEDPEVHLNLLVYDSICAVPLSLIWNFGIIGPLDREKESEGSEG